MVGKFSVWTLVWLGLSVIAAPQWLWGYEVAPVSDGGTLRGRVFLQGTPPPARIFHLIFSPNIDFCSAISDGKGNRLLKEFDVGAGGALKDVIVALVGVEKGKPFDHVPVIDIEHCRMTPFVTPVRNGRPIRLINRDPIAHDVQAYSLKGAYTYAMFNKRMLPQTEAAKKVRLRKGHYLFRTQCGVHDFMQSWGMAVGNPYFAVSGPEGQFEITDIPPGKYHAIAWHPHLSIQAKEVTVPPSGEVSVDFVFDAEEVEIPLHDLQEGYRLNTVLQPRHLVPPSVELQTP